MPTGSVTPKSNTGPFGIPPGGPWFVESTTGTIQRQSNPVLAEGLASSGQWVGFPTQAMAKAFADSDPSSHVKHAAHDVAHPLASITDFLTSSSTWIRIGEVVAGLLLVGIGVSAMLKNTPAVQSAAKTAGIVAKGAAIL